MRVQTWKYALWCCRHLVWWALRILPSQQELSAPLEEACDTQSLLLPCRKEFSKLPSCKPFRGLLMRLAFIWQLGALIWECLSGFGRHGICWITACLMKDWNFVLVQAECLCDQPHVKTGCCSFYVLHWLVVFYMHCLSTNWGNKSLLCEIPGKDSEACHWFPPELAACLVFLCWLAVKSFHSNKGSL